VARNSTERASCARATRVEHAVHKMTGADRHVGTFEPQVYY
jgi:hypothetical protein